MSRAFDPRAPLPAPPDPWLSSGVPSARPGPPYHMTDMIAAEPHLARRLLGRLQGDPGALELARLARETAAAGGRIVVTGCGTSDHAAQGVARILGDALGAAGTGPRAAVAAEQAFELALEPSAAGLVIGVSHEGGTRATIDALEAARDGGARTALITAASGSPGAAIADVVVATGEMDQSWCHTVGYVSPLLAATAVGAQIAGRTVDAEAVAELITAGAADSSAAEVAARAFGGVSRLIVVATGADRPAGLELTLKVEEASWLASAYRDLETFLHGHLPAVDASTGLIVLLTERSGRDARIARARQLLAACRVVGVVGVAILAAGAADAIEDELIPAGRLVVPEAPSLAEPVAALLGSAIPLQLLTERIARVRGTNPDLLRRDDERYREASAAAQA